MEITPQKALDCFHSPDLIGIGMEADAIRRALHPEDVITYAVPHTILLTLSSDDASSKDLLVEENLAWIDACIRTGETTVSLVSAAGSSLEDIEKVLRKIRRRSSSLRIHALLTREVLALAGSAGLSAGHTLEKLHAAGLDSICGDDLAALSAGPTPAGLLTLEDWIETHRLTHKAGLTSTAGLVFGLGETSEDRARNLFAIRELQHESGGFTAFSLLSPKPGAVEFLEPTTAVEFLRTLAVARIVLDNIANIESSCVAQGLKVTQMAFRFGANDAGALPTAAHAKKPAFTEEDLRRVIRDAGFIPVERDPHYSTLFLNN